MVAITRFPATRKPARVSLLGLLRRLLTLRPRFARIHLDELPAHLQRDLGLIDGRPLPPRRCR